MKFTKLFMAMAATATLFAACEKEGNEGGNGGTFTETAPEFTSELSDIVVTAETLEDVITFEYSKADFGVATQIDYRIEAQIGEGLKSVVAESTTTTATASLEDINYELYVKLGITIGEPVDVNFYVSAQMGNSEKLYSQPKTIKVTAIEAGPKKSEWGLVGTINGWAAPDITMFEVDNYFVAYNVSLTASDEFKIRANAEWNDAKNYGTEIKGTFAPNTIIPVITSGGSQNIGVKEAGVYDIYFCITAGDETNPGTVYLMTAGKTPDQAGEAEVTYVDPTAESFNVGLSGSVLGWDDPAFDTGDRATFKSKTLTDEAKFAGNYVFELASLTVAASDEIKVRINGAWIGGGEGEATISGITYEALEGGNIKLTESGTYKVTISFDWDGLVQSNIVVTFSK